LIKPPKNLGLQAIASRNKMSFRNVVCSTDANAVNQSAAVLMELRIERDLIDPHHCTARLSNRIMRFAAAREGRKFAGR